MSKEADTLKSIQQDGWRLRLSDYAHHASNGQWHRYKHLEHLTDIVQEAALADGGRVIVNMPPRHGKSLAVSKWLPSWFLDWNPDKNVILASYGDSLAKDFGRMVRDHFIENPYTWSGIRPDKEAANNWETTEGGGMRTVGCGGPVTGVGGHLIIVDDIHKNFAESQSQICRRRVIDWFNSTLYTRAEPGASIIIVQTRWHEDDLTGYLLNDHQDDWKEVIFPAIAMNSDKLGREEGDALCPERYTTEALLKIKDAMGSFLFESLYQQQPAPPEGSVMRRDWVKYYNKLPEDLSDFISSWDMSFKETKGGSYTVGQVWARNGPDIYLLDQYRRRVDFPGARSAVMNMSDRWPSVIKHLIEDKANGPAIIASLRDKMMGILPITPKGGKTARLHSVAPLFETGNVYLPHPSIAPWVEDLVVELITYPNSTNDDQCDSLSMALSHYRGVRELVMC